eukprot:scaffold13.g399.t1
MLAQPLLLQQPLQTVLELLFSKLEAQQAAIKRLDGAAAAEAAARASFEAAARAEQDRADGKLSALDARLSAAEAAVAAAQQEGAATSERLAVAEAQLAGADNLAGRGLAVDCIADVLGIAVPQVQAPTSSRAGSGAPPSPAGGAGAVAPTGGMDGLHGVLVVELAATQAAEPAAQDAAHEAGQAANSSETPPSTAAVSGEEAAAAAQGVLAAPRTADVQPSGARRSAQDSPAAKRQPGKPNKPSSRRSSFASTAGGSRAPSEGGQQQQQAQHGGSTLVPRAPSEGGQQQQQAQHGGSTLVPRAPSAAPADAAPSHAAATQRPGTNGKQGGTAATASSPTARSAEGGALPRSARSPPAPVPAYHEQTADEEVVGAATVLESAEGVDDVLTELASAAADEPTRGAAAVTPALNDGGQVSSSGRTSPPAPTKPRSGTAALAWPRAVIMPLQQEAEELAGKGGAAPDGGQAGREVLRTVSDTGRKMWEVVSLLRKRPQFAQSGLLWKLQASLQSTLEEQEKLQGEVEDLRVQLANMRSGQPEPPPPPLATASEGVQAGAARIDCLQVCTSRIDTLERTVDTVQTLVTGESPRKLPPPATASDLKAVEDKVEALGGRLGDAAERLRQLEEAAAARREASTSAVTLLRTSSSGSSRADALEALQAHLLSQQQRLAAQMEELAAGIKAGIPPVVTASVGEAGKALERRLADRSASKQEVQALALKMERKVTREEVERMLRGLRAGPPPMPEGNNVAAGVKLKCLSCDSDLQPVYFATTAGVPQASADLRYSQLPTASPARPSTQSWAAADTAGERCGSPGQLPPVWRGGSAGAGSPSGAPPHTARVGFGAPASWMHRMRREGQGEGGRPQTAVPLEVVPSAGDAGLLHFGHAASQAPHHQSQWSSDGSEFLQAIREEPAAIAAAGDGVPALAPVATAPEHQAAPPALRTKSALPALGSPAAGKIRAVRGPSLPGGPSPSLSQASVALAAQPSKQRSAAKPAVVPTPLDEGQGSVAGDSSLHDAQKYRAAVAAGETAPGRRGRKPDKRPGAGSGEAPPGVQPAGEPAPARGGWGGTVVAEEGGGEVIGCNSQMAKRSRLLPEATAAAEQQPPAGAAVPPPLLRGSAAGLLPMLLAARGSSSYKGPKGPTAGQPVRPDSLVSPLCPTGGASGDDKTPTTARGASLPADSEGSASGDANCERAL